jgi:hypothetical protein
MKRIKTAAFDTLCIGILGIVVGSVWYVSLVTGVSHLTH